MAEFAEIGPDGKVLRVIVADQAFIDSGALPGVWVETGEGIRKNHAGPGFTYDKLRDAFIPPKPKRPDPTELFVFDEVACRWRRGSGGSR